MLFAKQKQSNHTPTTIFSSSKPITNPVGALSWNLHLPFLPPAHVLLFLHSLPRHSRLSAATAAAPGPSSPVPAPSIAPYAGGKHGACHPSDHTEQVHQTFGLQKPNSKPETQAMCCPHEFLSSAVGRNRRHPGPSDFSARKRCWKREV